MSLFGAKSPFQSMTLWGAMLSLGSSLEVLQEALRQIPLTALPANIGSALAGVIGLVGAVLAIIGRLKAKKRITLKG